MKPIKGLKEIEKYCNHHGYSDVTPFEVVKVISEQTVEVRQMDAKLVKAPTNIIHGGFLGHYVDNDAQSYIYSSNENMPTLRVRWSKAKKQWKSQMGRHIMDDKPLKFHDYNF